VAGKSKNTGEKRPKFDQGEVIASCNDEFLKEDPGFETRNRAGLKKKR
jgi:hypothetical protein